MESIQEYLSTANVALFFINMTKFLVLIEEYYIIQFLWLHLEDFWPNISHVTYPLIALSGCLSDVIMQVSVNFFGSFFENEANHNETTVKWTLISIFIGCLTAISSTALYGLAFHPGLLMMARFLTSLRGIFFNPLWNLKTHFVQERSNSFIKRLIVHFCFICFAFIFSPILNIWFESIQGNFSLIHKMNSRSFLSSILVSLWILNTLFCFLFIKKVSDHFSDEENERNLRPKKIDLKELFSKGNFPLKIILFIIFTTASAELISFTPFLHKEFNFTSTGISLMFLLLKAPSLISLLLIGYFYPQIKSIYTLYICIGFLFLSVILASISVDILVNIQAKLASSIFVFSNLINSVVFPIAVTSCTIRCCELNVHVMQEIHRLGVFAGFLLGSCLWPLKATIFILLGVILIMIFLVITIRPDILNQDPETEEPDKVEDNIELITG